MARKGMEMAKHATLMRSGESSGLEVES